MSDEPAAVRWKVVPQHTPRVARHCPNCESRRLYYSSDKFRVNAHQRKLDVWLIYRCEHCDYSLNVTVIERTNVKRIDHELHLAYMRNDVAVAWRYAFDRDTLKRHGVLIESDVEWTLETEPWPAPEASGDAVIVDVDMEYPVNVRVDRILAAGLELSRSKIPNLLKSGKIRTEPATLGKASRRVNAPFRATVDASVLGPKAEPELPVPPSV